MGAIAAILAISGAAEADIVRRMLATARHYDGPTAVSTCGACALGVISGREVTDAFISSPGALMAAVTGVFDNATAIRAALVGEPTPNNLADLVVAAFRKWGTSAPSRFRGPFAAVITNGTELWCFRDQLGWRPLHFHAHARRFVVATEPKQVIAGAELKREPNLAVIESILYARMDRNTPSALAGVERLPQATMLSVRPDGTSFQERYWRPQTLIEKADFPASEVTERFSAVFETAVSRCLTGRDVISLSGGIDSPAVAGFAAPAFKRMTNRSLAALSTVYPDYPRVDESRYISIVADYLGMELHTFQPKAGPWENLERWVGILDGPTPTLSLDEVTEYNRIAYDLGFRNVIGGDIAEAVINLNRHVIGHLFMHGRWGALARMSKAVRAQGTTWPQFGKFMIAPMIPGRIANWHLHRTGGDFPQRIPDWLSADKVNEVPFRADLMRPARKRWTGLQLHPFEGTTLTLEAGELAAHLSGITSRSPFGDVDLIEFFISLPAELKFPDLGQKTLIRRMLRGRVPDAILDRKDKTVFTDYIMAHLDYDVLRRYTVNPQVRIPGVDYEKLADRIERRDFKPIDYAWANDLLRIHVFLAQW